MVPRRTLAQGMSGDDVASLHDTLDAIGIEIDEDERARKQFGPGTRDAVTRIQLVLGLEPSGTVDPATLELALAARDRLGADRGESADTPRRYIVEGQVTDADGLPLVGVTVVALRVVLRDEDEIARAHADDFGRYHIEYSSETPAGARSETAGHPEADRLALRLRVLDASGKVLFESGIHHRVSRREQIPLAVGGPSHAVPSEFHRTLGAIDARLGQLRLEELEESDDHRDLTFLGDDTGVGRLGVAYQTIAARLAATTELPPELFYALFRQNVPADAAVRALAADDAGTDLDRNAQRLLDAVLSASPDIRAKAIATAIDAGLVAPSYAERAKDDLAKLSSRAVDAALAASAGMGKTPVRDVLTTAAKVPADKQRLFMERWSTASGPVREFWSELVDSKAFTKEEVADLQFAMTVGRFTRGHLPLVRAIADMRAEGEIADSRDLARLDAAAWRKLVEGADGRPPVGLPENFTARDDETAIEAYSRLLERSFERAYPTVAFSARLAADAESPFAAKETAVAFLDANPDFDVRRTNVDRYLRDNPEVLNVDGESARETLLTSQRLLKLVPRYGSAKALLQAGISSAQQIYSMGESRFRESFGAHTQIGEAEAARIYSVAEQTYAMALTLATRLGATIREINPAAIGPEPAPPAPAEEGAPAEAVPAPPAHAEGAPAEAAPVPELEAFPNLQTLFGSLDLCACTHCRSVLSPAAYLTDMLRFLSHRVTAGKSAKQALLERRPDLVQIELSCENTNIVLPYIDLVNELLEDAVAPPADLAAAARGRQTTLETPELNANPQYVNEAAYATLAAAVHPWGLPFDLPLLEARTYLERLGTDRLRLMRAVRKEPDLAAAETWRMAVEALGLSPLEADIVTDGPLAAAHQPWDYWGLTESGNTVQDPVETTKIYTGTWLEVLSHARILLDRGRLSHAELQQLLKTRFVNPGDAVTTSDTCDIGEMTVGPLAADVLDRLHRFVRLMRRLGWTPYDLDAAIEQLQATAPAGAGRLNVLLLRQLRAVTAAMRRFRIGAPEAIALLVGIDTHAVPTLPGQDAPRECLYDRLLQNLGVLNPVDPMFKLDATRQEIDAIAANPNLADHRDTLVAAFELSDADVGRAIAEGTDGRLTLANLSRLYRTVLLARGLGLTIEELLVLRDLAEMERPAAPGYEPIDPFDPARPELLERFCETVDAVRDADLDIPELDYLLRHRAGPRSGVAVDDVVVGTLLKSMREGLAKIAGENAPAPDPTGAQVRKPLVALLPAANVEPIMAILAGTSGQTEVDQSAAVAATLGSFVPVAEAQAKLVGAAALAAGTARYEYVVSALAAHARRTLGTGLIVQQLAEALGLATSTVRLLVGGWFASVAAPAAPMLEQFLLLPTVGRDPAKQTAPVARDEAGFADYFTAYTALDKAARLISGHGFSVEEVAWFQQRGVAIGWLDPTTLPATVTPTPEGRFTRWLRVAEAAQLKAAIPGDGAAFGGLLDVAAGTTKAGHLETIGTRLDWSTEDLDTLAGDRTDATNQGLLGLAFPDDYRSERALVALLRAFAQLRRLGVSASAAGDWTGPAVTAAQSAAIKQSVKAKYTADQWPEIAKPLRDVLRERQRDALVSYLLTDPPLGVRRWQSPNDVYSYYLIDVEMSACLGTSRIVQANATIQLFVQRCALGLEPDVTVDAAADGQWLEWKWMSRYRVWEANRKVFLYPENWIEPGLRRDKSPFFQDMENELLQGEITKGTAEAALRGYLEKLDGVARLDVVGTYFEAGTPNRLHVIGRKQGDPATYYHREWVDSSRWTAWTKVELDIVSDHVLPVAWNRRLYLFWAIVNRRADKAQSLPNLTPANSPPPATKFHLEVQLAWSELRDGKWQAKQTAPQTFIVRRDDEARSVTLKSSIADPLLRIDVFAESTHVVELYPYGVLLFPSRDHVGEFVMGGVGNSVEAYSVAGEILDGAGPGMAEIGQLAPALAKGFLPAPTNSEYNGMALAPVATTPGGSARQRIAPCCTTYDQYGTLVSETVLDRADRYRLLIPHQQLRFDSSLPFFYSDSQRSYFVIPQRYYQNGNYFLTTAPADVYRPNYRAQYKFTPSYHAFVPLLIRELNAGGVDRLYERRLQASPAAVQGVPAFDFRGYYQPTDRVIAPYPIEGIDFDYDAPYSIYNWELFFHAPFEIGQSLSLNQRFDEAKHFYEYVFDPTSAVDEPAPQRYWVTKRFHEMTGAEYRAAEIRRLTALINAHDPDAEHQVAQWRANPFEPHIVAGLRPVAYQRAIVMKYIDNLIAWGDQLFRQDTMESVNEATQLYVLAAELLGPRPEIVQPERDVPAKTYADIESDLDTFANAAIAAAENAIAPVQVDVATPQGTPQLPVFPPLYFCVPPNEKLLAYWDTVGDRLFKIRHCMNIEGVTRQLALFAPPIDPGLLVKAVAAGLDLGSVLSDSGSSLPPYRFRVMVREAMQITESVRMLGNELLFALEKRDAEKLALIRSSSERTLHKGLVEMRKKGADEAQRQIDALAKSREVTLERQRYFAERKDDLTNDWEAAALVLMGASAAAQAIALALDSASGAAHMIPEVQAGASGAGGSPHVTVKIGGPNVGRGTGEFAKAAKVVAALLQTGASMSSVLGGYQRRKQEWDFQHGLTGKELDVIDAQALTLAIRKSMAEKDQANEDVVRALADETDEFLRDRFTNQELYEWMAQQTSATYFQAYRLAYAVAQQAEACFRRELGVKDTSYVQFGYWDSLKKGLLAGDKLGFDLQRMETAYLSADTRELELTKNASLLQIDPVALVELRTKGECVVTLPELLFDLETPGHYMRRLKSVAITVPCVTGPYGNVSLTATLLDNHVRTSPSASAPYMRAAGDDARFTDDSGGFSSIVTSSGQNDPGLFELNHHDERYLPFEGSGAVGTWKLQLKAVHPQFDYRSLSDVILHLRYTARDGGAPLADAAAGAVRTQLNAVVLAQSRKGLYKLVSPKQELASQWNAFLHPAAGDDQRLAFDLAPDRFPFFSHGLDLKVTGIDIYAKLADAGDYSLAIGRPGAPDEVVTLEADDALGGVHHWGRHPLAPKSGLGRAPATAPHEFSLKVKRADAADFHSLAPDEVADLSIVFQYEALP